MAKEIVDLLYEFNTRADITIESLADLISDIAEPVVRCKDCKWRGELGCAVSIVDESDMPKDDDFCAWGERRTDE